MSESGRLAAKGLTFFCVGGLDTTHAIGRKKDLSRSLSISLDPERSRSDRTPLADRDNSIMGTTSRDRMGVGLTRFNKRGGRSPVQRRAK